ncbi:MAG: sensor domain-containing diguanylate cyclase [Candidatus Omnitrophica bacterium]|nr:sensor domain-containing diguanylate cyclase [Candidatus Omnitrophota bacterium]
MEIMDQEKYIDNTKQDLERARAEISMLYEISNAMRSTLNLDEILYIILTAVTSHAGLGFNRAMLFMVNEKGNALEGRMGIGPQSGEEAYHIWKKIEGEQMDLNDLIEAYKEFAAKRNTPLDNTIKDIKVPLREDGGIIALTAMEGKSFEVNTHETRVKINDLTLQFLHVDHFVSVPLKAKDKVIGVILADNFITKKPIAKDDVRMLNMFANHAGLAIENSRFYEQALRLSQTDYLTQLWNHGYFQHIIADEFKKATESKHHLSIIMLDIDNFKNYNDKLGHQYGDAVLREIGNIIKESLRKSDSPCRYGGEEFVIILPQTSKDEAYKFAERLRTKIEFYNFSKEEVQPYGKITVSSGVATYPEDASEKDELIYTADMALLQAKQRGRNRSCIYSPDLTANH